jgi:peptidoglycan/xylan/chitin deacetylase (PgdA/CDA1 family)
MTIPVQTGPIESTIVDLIPDENERQLWQSRLLELDSDSEIAAMRGQASKFAKPKLHTHHIMTTPGGLLHDGALTPGQVALTFDDGPHPIATEMILQVLNYFGVPCNFFQLGREAQKHPSISKATADSGHIVGSHSMTHRDLLTLPKSEAYADIVKGAEAVANASGSYMPFFRFPYGNRDKTLLEFVGESDMVAFHWQINPLDSNFESGYRSSLKAMLKKTISTIESRGCGVLLLHERTPTAFLLADILRYLIAREFTIVQFAPQKQSEAFVPKIDRLLRAGSSDTALRPERYCAAKCSHFLIGGDEFLVHSPATKATLKLRDRELSMLRSCDQFASIDQHARRICVQSGIGLLHFQATQQLLQRLADSGLLIPTSALVANPSGSATDSKPAQIRYLGILTRNRPSHLAQSLQSYAECIAHYDKNVVIAVADQSDPNERAANLEVMTAIKKKFGVSIIHIDDSDAAAFAAALAQESGLPISIVNFAINNEANCRVLIGANRNRLLLSCLDELMVQADDDSQCRVMAAPLSYPGLAISSSGGPMQYWFPPSHQPINLEELENRDFFALHEILLGKSVQQLLKQHLQTGEAHLDDIRGPFIESLSQADRSVVITNLGVVGDSGMGEWQSFLTSDNHTQLTSSHEHYEYVQASHQIMQAVTRPTISDSAHSIGLSIGIDNRDTLPPFFPVLRGEDTVFGRSVLSTRGGYLGFLPWMLYHEGAKRHERNRADRGKLATKIIFAEILASVMKSKMRIKPRLSVRESLVAMGSEMVRLASLSPDTFHDVLRLSLWRQASWSIKHHEAELRRHGSLPAFWSRDVADFIEEKRRKIFEPDFGLADDVVAEFGLERALSVQQDLMLRLGQLYAAWPEIRSAATRLKQRGVCLGRQI